MPEIQVFKISTPASAIFRAKRWFYARFYTPAYKSGKQELAEKNKEHWTNLAGKIVEKTQNLGRDAVVRLQIVFDTKIHGYTRDNKGNLVKVEEFIPIGVKLEIYEKKSEEIIELMEGAEEVIKSTVPSPQQEEL